MEKITIIKVGTLCVRLEDLSWFARTSKNPDMVTFHFRDGSQVNIEIPLKSEYADLLWLKLAEVVDRFKAVL